MHIYSRTNDLFGTNAVGADTEELSLITVPDKRPFVPKPRNAPTEKG